MLRHLIYLSLACGMVGCGGKGATPPSQPPAPPVGKIAPTGVSDADTPPQPADARYTIACTDFTGPGRIEKAKIAKQQLIASTGDSQFYVVHEDDRSVIFHGYYRFQSPRERDKMSPADIQEGRRAQLDLRQMQTLKDRYGSPVFTAVTFSPLEPIDPPAPPEWNLLNVDRAKEASDPTRAYWTLQVAIFKDTAERKKDAVESVRMIRDQLKLKEVYFYHGKTASSVCLGLWPREAVRDVEAGNAEPIRPDDRLLVTAQRFPKGVAMKFRDSEGNVLKNIAPRLEAVDPTLIDFMSRYDRLAVNGNDIQYTQRLKAGGVRLTYEPSQVVMIPRAGERGLLDGSDPAKDAGPPNPFDEQFLMPNRSDGAGQLRGIGQ